MDHSSWRRECHVATTLCLGQDRLSLGGGGRTALGQVFHGVHGRSVLDAEEQLAVSDSVPCFKMVGFVAALVQALQSPGKLIFTRRLVGFRHSVSVDDKGKKVLGLVMIASTVGNRTLMVDSVDMDKVLNGALPIGFFCCLVQSKPNRLVLAGHFVRPFNVSERHGRQGCFRFWPVLVSFFFVSDGKAVSNPASLSISTT